MVYGMMSGGWAWNALYLILLIGLIMLVYLGVAKLWEDVFPKKRRR
ncbi:MAG: hypothetical protein J4473_01950 [Candidatus Aenigmarchaeota archaeon]|nr:hypothetical protein [Candidatus Aenigmarchaeota archaeon]